MSNSEPSRPGRRILVVDDEQRMIRFIRMNLDLEGFSVHEAYDGKDALNQVRKVMPDLEILDVMMPKMDGFETLGLLRETSNVPVIMLTARGDEDDRVRGLELGADDYVTKPFRLGVLLARIRAQLRQHEQSEDAIFTIGKFSFRPAAKMLIDPDSERKIRLTEKETAILKYLYRARDQVVGRDVLLNEVWGYNAGVATHTLETHIYRLRQKIETDPSSAQLLVTEGGGYRLVSPK